MCQKKTKIFTRKSQQRKFLLSLINNGYLLINEIQIFLPQNFVNSHTNPNLYKIVPSMKYCQVYLLTGLRENEKVQLNSMLEFVLELNAREREQLSKVTTKSTDIKNSFISSSLHQARRPL
jgi:hypothetical protein